MNYEPLLILFALLTGMWAAGERSLRKSMKENYDRACRDGEFYRDLWRNSIKDLSDRLRKEQLLERLEETKKSRHGKSSRKK